MARRKRNTNTAEKDAGVGKDSASAEVAENSKIPPKCPKPSSIAANKDNQKLPFLDNFGLTTKSSEATLSTSEYKRGRPKKVLLLKSAEKTDKPIEKRCTRLSHPVQDMIKLPEKNSPKKKRSGVKYFPEISLSFENVTFTLPETDQTNANLRKSKSISPSKKQNFMSSSSKLLDLSFIPDNEMFGQEMNDCPKIVDLSLSPNEPYQTRAELRKSKSVSPTKKQKALDMPFISDKMFNQGLSDSQDNKYNSISLSCLLEIIGCETIQKESSEEAIKSDKVFEESPLIEAVTTAGKLQKSRKTNKRELLKNRKTLDSNTSILSTANLIQTETSETTKDSGTEEQEVKKYKRKCIKRKPNDNTKMTVVPSESEIPIPIVVLNRTNSLLQVNIDKCDMAAFRSKSTDVQSETKKYNMIDAQALQKHSIKRNDNSIISTAKTTIPKNATVVPCETSIETVAGTTEAETEEDQESKKQPSRRKRRNHYSVILTSTTNETIPTDTTLVPCETSIKTAESATVAETKEEQESKKRQSRSKQRNHDSAIPTSITNETTFPRDTTLVPCETSIETAESATVAEKESEKRPSRRKQRNHDSVVLTSTTNETTILRDANIVPCETSIETISSATVAGTEEEQESKKRPSRRKQSTTNETTILRGATIVPCETSIETVASATDVFLSDGTKEQQPKIRQSKRKQRDSDPMIPTTTTFPNEKTPSDAAVISSETTIEAVASAEAVIPCDVTDILSKTAKEQEAKIHQSKRKNFCDDFVFPKPKVVPNASLIISSDTMKDSRPEKRDSKKHKHDHDTTRVAPSETPVVQTGTVTKSRADVEKTKKHQRKDKKHDTAKISSARNTIERGLTKPHSNSSAPIVANILVTDKNVIFLPIENENKKSNRSDDDNLHKKTKTPGVDPNATAVTKVSEKTDKGKLKKNHIDTAALCTAPESEIDNNVTEQERNKTSKTREELLKIFNAIENSYAEDEGKPYLEMHADTIDWEENCADVWEANPFIPCGREWTAVRKPQLDEWDANPLRETSSSEEFPSCSYDADRLRSPSPTFSDTDDILSLTASSLNVSISHRNSAEEVYWKKPDPVKPAVAPIRAAEDTQSVLAGICLLSQCSNYSCTNKHGHPQDLSEEIGARLSGATLPQLFAAYDSICNRVHLCNFWLHLFLERCQQMHFAQLVLQIALDVCGGSVSNKQTTLLDCARILSSFDAKLWLYSDMCLKPIGETRTLADALLSVCHLKPYASQSRLIASLGKILDDGGRSIESDTLNKILNNMIFENVSPQYYTSAYEGLLRKMSINHFKALDRNVLRRFIEKLKESNQDGALEMENRLGSLLNPNPLPVVPAFSQPPPNLGLFNRPPPRPFNQFNIPPPNQYNATFGLRGGNFLQNRFPNPSGFPPRTPQQHNWWRGPPNRRGKKR